jgi:PAS domain S-box-containing protein
MKGREGRFGALAMRGAGALAAAVGGWLLFRLIGAWPWPAEWTLSFATLARWVGPLEPVALDAADLALARQAMEALALGGAAVIALLLLRGFFLASRNATLRDRLDETSGELASVSGSFRDLVMRTHDVHYRHDLTGRLEWMSESALRLLGYAERDVPSLSIADVLDADHLAALRSAAQPAAAAGRAAPRRDVLARTRDGRPIWLEMHERVVQQDGVPVGVEGVGLDVTARKVAETGSAVSAEIARALAETSSLDAALRAVLAVVGRELHWEYGEAWWADDQFDLIRSAAAWSARGEEGALAEARKRTFSRGVGLPGRVWSQGETIESRDLAADPDPWCARIAAESPYRHAIGIPIRLGTRAIGAVLFASARAEGAHWAPVAVLDAIGREIGAVADRRRAEEALKVSEARKQAVLETALDCVITADHEGRILEWNPAAEEAFGIRRDEALGRPLAELIVPPDLRARHLEGFRGCLDTGRRPLGDARVEVEALRADGSRFAAELSIARIDVGRHPVFTAHVRDITERKALDRLKDELVSTVSHELRTPLASIRGFVELLLMRDYPPDERREFLGIVDQEIKRLGKLIDDFLDLQRLEASSGAKYRMEPLDLREILEHGATVIGATSAAHALEIDLPADPLPVAGDRDRLEQAVLNLLSNAVKYSPDGGTVRLRAERAGGRVLVHVRDEGIGMSPETLEQLFTKFFRADNTATRGIGGTGLGLALVREIAEAHGGQVEARSQLGKGSEFTLSLPERQQED